MSAPLPGTELTALLGHGTFFEGKLHFEGQLRIDGRFKGAIRTDGVLVLGEGSEVDAQISAASVIVRGGKTRGNIRASRSIELYVPAKVTGDLAAPEIFMDRGVEFSGQCSIERPDVSDSGSGDAES